MSAITIQPISAFFDNYIWSIQDSHSAIIVDPGKADPVIEYLSAHKLSLNAILVTHHHPDHVGGIKQLKQTFPEAKVIGFRDARYDGIEYEYTEGDSFTLLGLEISLFEVPGHTLDHVAFVTAVDGTPCLFSGDTLFSGGCGRLFEGSAEQMHNSLGKFKALPDNTKIYCAHEYTLSNLGFAQTLMPENPDLEDYLSKCEALRKNNQSTIPTTLHTEKKINPFLRETDPEIIDNLEKLGYTELDNSVNCFAAIRKAKDQA
jgi:hydroxyacylglutathione hydrolase